MNDVLIAIGAIAYLALAAGGLRDWAQRHAEITRVQQDFWETYDD